MAKASFQYKGSKRTVEDVKRAAKRSSDLYDGILLSGVSRFKVNEGDVTVRILPGTWEDDEKWGNGWEIKVFVHFNIGPDRGQFLCLDKMNGEPCPICEARRETEDEDERDALRPGERFLCWVIDRDDEGAGPQVWEMPATVRQEINGRAIDKKKNSVILLDDVEEGYDITFNRQGTGKKSTKYTGFEVSREASPLGETEKQEAKWMKYIEENPLPDLLNFQEPEYIEKVLMGRSSKKDEEEEGEGEEVSRGRGSARRPSRKPEREAEEEAEEAEEKPRRGVGRKRTDDPPEEEEAEDEAPRSRRRPVRSEPEEEAEAEEETPPQSRAARKGLERLKPRGKREEPEEAEEEEKEERTTRRRR